MAQHRLVEPGLLAEVRGSRRAAVRLDGQRARDHRSPEALGVHGIATADPRFFA